MITMKPLRNFAKSKPLNSHLHTCRLFSLLLALFWINSSTCQALLLRSVDVSTGADVIAALADSTVGFAIVTVPQIFLTDDSFGSLATTLFMDRNFMVAGSPTLPSWPLVDFGFVRGKVLLGPGVNFTLYHVVTRYTRDGSVSRAPGMDIFWPLPPPNATSPNTSLPTPSPGPTLPSIVIFNESSFQNMLCNPISIQLNSVGSIPRPAAIPGKQYIEINAPQPPVCVNDSLYPMQSCFPNINFHSDVALMAINVDPVLSKTVPAGFYMWLYKTYEICRQTMPPDCVTRYGSFGCFSQMYKGHGQVADYQPVDQFPTAAPLPSRAPGPLNGSGSGAGSSNASAAGLPHSRDDSERQKLLAGVLGGVLGGVTLIVLIAVAILLWRRRTATRSKPYSSSASGISTDPAGKSDAGLASQQKAASVQFGSSGDRSFPASSRVLGSGGDGESGAGVSGSVPMESNELLPVTLLQPLRPDMQMVGPLPSNEVTLLPVVRGKGAFGRVVEGMFQGQHVAIKLLPELVEFCSGAAREVNMLAQEVQVMGRCAHPNVVRLLAACLQPPRPCLVMELMDTSLENVLYGAGGDDNGEGDEITHELLPLPKVLHIAVQIAQGLEYLHPTIMHRDLKPANVLLRGVDGPAPEAKLADFGLSRLRHTTLGTKTPEAGTPSYMAPECFDLDSNIITHHADIFSFGCLMWSMLTGRKPWKGCDMVQVATKVTLRNERLPLEVVGEGRLPPRLEQVIMHCWERDPRRRPAAAELVKELGRMAQVLGSGFTTDTSAPLSCNTSVQLQIPDDVKKTLGMPLP